MFQKKIFFDTVGDTAGVSCVFTPGADEKCDDGGGKGKYGYIEINGEKKSRCDKYCGDYSQCMSANSNDALKCEFMKKSGYNGRIAGGTEYFCGDKVVQYKGESCTGVNCKEISADNYPGATITDAPSEKCDPSDTLNSRNTLCNRALNKTSTPASGYYGYTATSSSPSCASDCLSINDSTDTTGCNYCGDGVKADSETCEPGESSATICAREGGSYYGNNQNYIWNFESSSWPTWISATVSSWGLNSTYKYSGSYSYCSTNTTDSTTGTLTLNVTAQKAGTVSFYIYGTSEKNYDYLYITQNGSQVWSSKGTDYGSWTKLSFSVSAGSTPFVFTYYKDSSQSSGIDKYCVDYLEAPSAFIPYTSQTTNPSNKTCNSNCTLSSGTCYSGWCGDGTTQSAYEVCDSGSSNSDSWASSSSNKHCNSNCTGWAPYCGDGVVNGSEACEPGVSTKADEKGAVCDEGGWNESDTYWRYRYTCTSSCTWTYTRTCDW